MSIIPQEDFNNILVKTEDFDVIKLCLKAGANINFANSDGRTVLSTACRLNRVDIVKFLLEQPGINVNLIKGYYSPILETKKFEIVKMLIEAGAEIDAKYPSGLNLLYKVCYDVDNYINLEKNVEYLLKLPGMTKEIINGNNKYHPILCLSITFNILKMLVEAGADINVTDGDGDSLIMCKARWGSLEEVKYLLSIGADITIRNKANKTIYDYVKSEYRAILVSEYDFTLTKFKALNIEEKNKIMISEFSTFTNDEKNAFIKKLLETFN